MAENAAHKTSSLQAKPSIFEVIAQESLSNLLHPSFKIIVQFLSSSHPQRYYWLNEWYEEVFLVVNGLLQLYYLNNKEASFSESFYGLKRVFSHRQTDTLSSQAKCWSLFCLIGLPYLTHKIEKYTATTHRVSLCHRAVLASWRTVSLVQYLLYLTGRVGSHSPLLAVANLTLQYCPEHPDQSYSWRDYFSSPRACAKLLGNSLTQSLELAAFFLQCLQWWHSDEISHEKLSGLVPPPPPPPVTDFDKYNPAICPVCKEQCSIETVLLTSGYVFCYRCVREAVVNNRKCPVTGLPTTLDELVRLYPTI